MTDPVEDAVGASNIEHKHLQSFVLGFWTTADSHREQTLAAYVAAPLSPTSHCSTHVNVRGQFDTFTKTGALSIRFCGAVITRRLQAHTTC
jgi:hypothetical protein